MIQTEFWKLSVIFVAKLTFAEAIICNETSIDFHLNDSSQDFFVHNHFWGTNVMPVILNDQLIKILTGPGSSAQQNISA